MIVIILILITIILGIITYFIDVPFFYSAIEENIILNMVLLLFSVNTASISILLTKIIDLEEKYNKTFEKTRKEIVENSTILLIALLINVFCPLLYSNHILLNHFLYSTQWGSAIFSLYAVFEINIRFIPNINPANKNK